MPKQEKVEKVVEELKPIFDQIRKWVDRGGALFDIGLKAGVAYLGYRSVNHWVGALTGLLGLQLARSDNLAAGAAGIATLAGIGVSNWWQALAIAQGPPGYSIPQHMLRR